MNWEKLHARVRTRNYYRFMVQFYRRWTIRKRARHWSNILELTFGIRRSKRRKRAISIGYAIIIVYSSSRAKESEAGSSLRAKLAQNSRHTAIRNSAARGVARGVLGSSRNELAKLFKAGWNNLVRPHFPTRQRLTSTYRLRFYLHSQRDDWRWQLSSGLPWKRFYLGRIAWRRPNRGQA